MSTILIWRWTKWMMDIIATKLAIKNVEHVADMDVMVVSVVSYMLRAMI